MASVSGLGHTFNLPNYVGELFFVTPKETPFLSMIGGLTGGVGIRSTIIQWQTVDNAAAAQPDILEGANATFAERSRSNVFNVIQIFQEGVQLSYTKQAAVDNISGQSILGNQPVQNERQFQVTLKLQKMARDIEFTFLRGTFQNPSDNTTSRRTRGLTNAITTNTVAASSARLNQDHIDELLREMADSGAPMQNVVVFANAFNRQRISKIYGYAPEDRNVGGLSIKQIETDFGEMGVVYDRHMVTSEIFLTELSVCRPRILFVPEKGFLFVEPLSKDGAADKWQLYGEIGLEYGPEEWHGSVTGTATS